ncbi:MAG: glycosyltransferase, partial [Planctomycetaceae bacterium]|nr:glycosyltransferase [Planctomycetaceae bacterium]
MDAPRDVILVSTADWDHPFWTNKQHVASQLAARGFRVLYIESLGLRRPSAQGRDLARIWRRLRRGLAAPRQVRENLWVAAPLVIPLHRYAPVRALNDRLLVALLRRAAASLGFRRPLLWTYNPLVGHLAGQLDAEHLVYHCVDDLSAVPQAPAEALLAAERQIARTADLILTTSPSLQKRFEAWRPEATYYLPNVADYEHFSRAKQPGLEPAELAAIPHPRIGFIGAISDYKVDFELLAATARLRPDWQWVLIGQVGEGQPDTRVAGLDLPNVHLLGPRPYARLPDYLRAFDAATSPSRRNAYTDSMFPMKFFEYLSAGRRVVATRIPALEEFADVAELIETPGEFAAALDRIAAGAGPDLAAI